MMWAQPDQILALFCTQLLFPQIVSVTKVHSFEVLLLTSIFKLKKSECMFYVPSTAAALTRLLTMVYWRSIGAPA